MTQRAQKGNIQKRNSQQAESRLFKNRHKRRMTACNCSAPLCWRGSTANKERVTLLYSFTPTLRGETAAAEAVAGCHGPAPLPTEILLGRHSQISAQRLPPFQTERLLLSPVRPQKLTGGWILYETSLVTCSAPTELTQMQRKEPETRARLQGTAWCSLQNFTPARTTRWTQICNRASPAPDGPQQDTVDTYKTACP